MGSPTRAALLKVMDEQPGFTPEEIERGEDRAWHIPIWGCATTIAVVLLGCYALYRFFIGIGSAAQIRL